MGSIDGVPYIAVGNDELGEKVGVSVVCPHCKKKHKVQYGNEILSDGTKIPSKMLGFVKCGKDAYLVAVNGKQLP